MSVCPRGYLRNHTRYDTIRYINVRSKADEMASLIECTAQKRKNKEKIKINLCMLPIIAVARSSSGVAAVAISYVLPVLWMTSVFSIMGRIAV